MRDTVVTITTAERLEMQTIVLDCDTDGAPAGACI